MRHTFQILLVSLAAGICLQASASAQDTLPPVVVRPGQTPSNTGPIGDFGNPDGTISWSSDAITSDSQFVGPYGQPQWTTTRTFATTRAYVLPPGEVDVEQWVRETWHRDAKSEYRFLEELAIGLPGRFQLDVYERWNIEPDGSNNEQANHEGVQIEGRWALADWDVLPLNPTLYLEWVEKGGPQEKPNQFEAKLLLAQQFGNIFFATNFNIEQEVDGDERATELAWSTAWTTPIIERFLMAGFETNYAATTVKGSRGNPEEEFLIGPSMHLQMTNRLFLDVVGLFGTTKESPEAQMYVILGYQFGSRAGPTNQISAPTTARGS